MSLGALNLFSMFTLFLEDIDNCTDQPCLNGGTCIDSVNDYTCKCAVGYTGKNCSIGKNKVSVLVLKNYIVLTSFFLIRSSFLFSIRMFCLFLR